MLRILHNTRYDFIGLRYWTYGLTALFVVPGIIYMAIAGFRYSIEFTGGTLMQVQFRQAPDVGELRATLSAAGMEGAEIQSFGSATEYVIRAQDAEHVAQQSRGAENVSEVIRGALTRKYGAGSFRVVRTEAVGPKVGAELRQRALYAILISFLVTMVYLAWRFEWRFGVAAILATAHDILATLAFIKYLDLEVSLVVVGAILTMIGYSLNDTIVIFDRVRENLHKKRKESLYDTLNRSVNETLPRTVLTSVTTVATLLALALVGGVVIRPFALVMLFGVVTGTFSSIFVAAPVLLLIETRWPRALGDKGGVGLRSHAATASPRKESAKVAQPAGRR
ncbi:MAG: protein translocase subunit SecF [Gemmatimonadaceae bacterium]